VRVLFVGAHLAKGGGQAVQTLLLFRALRGTVERSLYCLDTPGIHREALNDPDVHVVGRLEIPGGTLALARSIRENAGAYDVIHVFDPYFGLPASFLARVGPRVVRFGADPVWDVGWRYNFMASIGFRVGLPALLMGAHLVTNSQALAERFRAYPVTVIPNGVDFSRADRHPSRESVRERLGIPPGQMVCVFVGKVLRLKRVEWLLEALRRVPETHGLVVGSLEEEHFGDAYYRELRARYPDLNDRVTFTGEVRADQVPEYLAAADIFVLPSRVEGMPNALLEAMAAGLPCVVSDIPAHRSVVADRATGFLVTDPSNLAEVLSRLSSDAGLRRRVGGWAQVHVRARFSIERSAARYVELYRRVADHGASPFTGSSSVRNP
jgi:glycosyltransferase involved in cell wall biosynthesis